MPDSSFCMAGRFKPNPTRFTMQSGVPYLACTATPGHLARMAMEPAKAVLSKIGGELRLAPEPTPEGILSVARDADAVLTTYAKVTGEMIPQMTKCRVISRFGIGVDNVDIPVATSKGIVVTKVPD